MALVTPNLGSLKYNYFKTCFNRVDFYVKTKKNAHICLSNESNTNQPFIEFVIETNVTDVSELRLKNGSTWFIKSSIVRKNLLSESEYRGFWIIFNEGNYSLGCDGELVPFLEWEDPHPFKINYVGVSSNGYDGFWKMCLESFKLPSWVPASIEIVPSNAIETGESKRGPHYIARVRHEISQSFIPARLLPGDKCLYGFLGLEHESKEYEVLCGGSGYWVEVIDGNIPGNAFDCTDATMENKIFIGRASIDDWLLCGKVYQRDGLCLIAYLGKEYIFGNYEIFVV